MATTLYDVISWAQENGEVKVLDRIKLRVLSITLKEKIVLNRVSRETICSAECLDAVRRAAVDVVGKPCPY